MASRERYVASLDGLRAASILIVIFAHVGVPGLPGGFGVTLFFFISGLLITQQLHREIVTEGHIRFANFYLRRGLRLLPAGLCYLVIAGGIFAALGGVITLWGWLAAVFYGGNYYDLFVEYDTTIAGVRHPFNIIWSLAIEEHFYMIWPLALAVLAKRRHAPVYALLFVCAASLAWREYLYQDCFTGHPGALCGLRIESRNYKATDTRLDSIAWGALVALLNDGAGPSWLRQVVRRLWLQAVMAVALLLTFLIPGDHFREVYRYSIQGAALACLVPPLIESGNLLRRLLETAPAVFIGRLSYSLYLWHWAAFSAADYLLPDGKLGWGALGLSLSAILSCGSFFLVERPMIALRRRFGSNTPAKIIPATG